ncbi:PH domain-containing protein [Plasmodiophora brassicae]|uniref:PH domain-containing protein n=1 Tax=Plasmodiophora brassicae TaxID=37360 RepID=A0A0G4II15_PLABS|nr:hypothetical protein PBRA_000503 [Plasmodiophora brassicae]SPQ93024.1 unnamed protein product [Plasmodiophora brassicae]
MAPGELLMEPTRATLVANPAPADGERHRRTTMLSAFLSRRNTGSQQQQQRRPSTVNWQTSTSPAAPVSSAPASAGILLSTQVTCKDASVLLTVTERAVVESPGKSRPFVDVYAVARDPSDANVVTVHWIKSSAGGVGAKVKIVGVRDYVSVRRYRCASSEDCDNVMVALECLVRRAWQSLCESSIMPAPEIYQAHAFVDKLNRKGVLQNRVLAVSNEWVYNLECGYGPVTIKNAKWAVPIKAIVELSVSRHNRMPLLAMTMDPAAMGAAADKTRALGGEHAPKSQHQFCFYSMALLENFITVIRTLSFASNHTGLKVVVSDDAKRRESVSPERSTSVAGNHAMQGFLLKHRKNKKGKPHRRFVRVNTGDGTIAWSESELASKVLHGKILSFEESRAAGDAPFSFAVRTDAKVLFFVAESEGDYTAWCTAFRSIHRRGSNAELEPQ